MAKISRLETIVNKQKGLLLSLDMANNGWSTLNQFHTYISKIANDNS